MTTKTEGKGGLTSCPYCGECLDYHNNEYTDNGILWTDTCPKCEKFFTTTYKAVSWKEDKD